MGILEKNKINKIIMPEFTAQKSKEQSPSGDPPDSRVLPVPILFYFFIRRI